MEGMISGDRQYRLATTDRLDGDPGLELRLWVGRLLIGRSLRQGQG
jgi:hypothetical protein